MTDAFVPSVSKPWTRWRVAGRTYEKRNERTSLQDMPGAGRGMFDLIERRATNQCQSESAHGSSRESSIICAIRDVWIATGGVRPGSQGPENDSHCSEGKRGGFVRLGECAGTGTTTAAMCA